MNSRIWKAAAARYRRKMLSALASVRTHSVMRTNAEAQATMMRNEIFSLTSTVRNLGWTLEQVKSERDAAFDRESKLKDELNGANVLIDSLDDSLDRARRERDHYLEELERLKQETNR